MLPRSTDVFVIGGGPAGLAAALAVRRRGFDVAVADCDAPPIDKACGEGLMPDGRAAARELGLDLDDGIGRAFRGIRFFDGGACAAADFPHGHGIGIRRTALHQLLVDRAAASGVQTLWRTHVTGISGRGVQLGGTLVRARWIVGADGGQSRVRRWAGLDRAAHESCRFGFRRHYRVEPWSDHMEIHWGARHQLYVTPVAADEVCVVLISRDRNLRLDDALPHFPELARRLAFAAAGVERGGASVTRRLKAVCRGNVALAGDASGSVDAVTGEGLCLSFQHAAALADALAAGDLSGYQRAHRRIARRPEFMGNFMLLMDGRRRLRGRAIRALAARPALFARMLAMHVGELSTPAFLANSLGLGWEMLTV